MIKFKGGGKILIRRRGDFISTLGGGNGLRICFGGEGNMVDLRN